MPFGVVPSYRTCLLVCCHYNRYSTSRVQMGEGWIQLWCYLYIGAITSDMSADPVPLSMPASTVQLYHTCMLCSFIQIHVFVNCFSIRQGIWSVTYPSDMPTGVRCRSDGFVNLSATILGHRLGAILNISNSE